jgi:HSP20 family protein
MSCCNTNAVPSATGVECRESSTTFQPNVDVFETPDEWVISADLPGASPESLEVGFEDGTLHVKASVPARQTDATSFLVREYPVGSFERNFRVGPGVDPSRISAGLDAGVLTIHLPKSESSRARKIQIAGV